MDLLVLALIIAIADDVLNAWSATLRPRGHVWTLVEIAGLLELAA